jgi:hypothetical protein
MTNIVQNNLNPTFHEAIDFLYPVLIDKKMSENPQYLFENFPPIVIDVMDVDSKLVGKEYEDIGRAVIHLKIAALDLSKMMTHKRCSTRPKNVKALQIRLVRPQIRK